MYNYKNQRSDALTDITISMFKTILNETEEKELPKDGSGQGSEGGESEEKGGEEVKDED